MSKRSKIHALILAEGIAVGVPGAVDGLRRIFSQVMIDEVLVEEIVATIGVEKYRQLVAA